MLGLRFRVMVRVRVRVWLGVRGYEIRGIEFHSVIRPVDNESGSRAGCVDTLVASRELEKESEIERAGEREMDRLSS